MQPLVFIPPSETKAPGGEASFLSGHGRFRELAHRRERVLAALERAMKGKVADREDVLNVKGDALAEATQKNLAVRGNALTMPALQRFTGVMYQNVGYATLPDGAKRALQDHVLVVDGLYGLLAPADEIPDYKLPMDATLPDVGRLPDFWREGLGLLLDQQFKGKREIWDLLPDVHRRALPKDLPVALSVEFVEVAGGTPKTVTHGSKALKGQLLRHLALHGFRREVAESFSHDGFALDRERSRGTTLVFSKAVEPAPKKAPAKAAPKKAASKKAVAKKAAKPPAKKAAKRAKREA